MGHRDGDGDGDGGDDSAAHDVDVVRIEPAEMDRLRPARDAFEPLKAVAELLGAAMAASQAFAASAGPCPHVARDRGAAHQQPQQQQQQQQHPTQGHPHGHGHGHGPGQGQGRSGGWSGSVAPSQSQPSWRGGAAAGPRGGPPPERRERDWEKQRGGGPDADARRGPEGSAPVGRKRVVPTSTPERRLMAALNKLSTRNYCKITQDIVAILSAASDASAASAASDAEPIERDCESGAGRVPSPARAAVDAVLAKSATDGCYADVFARMLLDVLAELGGPAGRRREAADARRYLVARVRACIPPDGAALAEAALALGRIPGGSAADYDNLCAAVKATKQFLGRASTALAVVALDAQRGPDDDDMPGTGCAADAVCGALDAVVGEYERGGRAGGTTSIDAMLQVVKLLVGACPSTKATAWARVRAALPERVTESFGSKSRFLVSDLLGGGPAKPPLPARAPARAPAASAAAAAAAAAAATWGRGGSGGCIGGSGSGSGRQPTPAADDARRPASSSWGRSRGGGDSGSGGSSGQGHGRGGGGGGPRQRPAASSSRARPYA